MAFLISAKWAWVALKFILQQREELKKIRRKGLVVVLMGCTSGLGMEIVQAVCDRLSTIKSHGPHTLITTTKDEENGVLTLGRLRHPTVRVGYHQLDASCNESVRTFLQNLKEQFESVDILINNAGILPSTFELGCKDTAYYLMKEDYYETKLATLALMPLMAPGGRVVIVASSLAELAIRWMNEEAFTKLFSAASTEKDLDSVANSFFEELGDEGARGRRVYDALAYPFAQAARIALAQCIGNKLKMSSSDPKSCVTVCSFSPGWCRTLPGRNRAPFSAAEGAAEAVFAAFDANPEEVQGSFIVGRKPGKFGDEIASAHVDNALPKFISAENNHMILKHLPRCPAAIQDSPHAAEPVNIVM